MNTLKKTTRFFTRGKRKHIKDNIRLYHKNGYKDFKQEIVSEELTFVFLEKTE